MERTKFCGLDEARADIGELSKPGWLESQHNLPFSFLSDDEFEIFCYLLLKYENPDDDIFYYGKTGDLGRDIVWIKDDLSIELIQCKRYEKNINLTEIEKELVKLYKNIFLGKIPDIPYKISFYVTPDLTSPAKDLLSPKVWIHKCQSIFKKHLKSDPEKDFLDLAKSNIKINHENSINLTQRAKIISKNFGLIDDFFDYKKVVDTKAVDNIEQKMSEMMEILRSGELRTKSSFENPIETISKILKKAEDNAPGIAFRLRNLDSNGTCCIEIIAKPGFKDITAAVLSFPDTDSGKYGAQKFRKFIEKGYPIQLNINEYDLEYKFPLPPLGEGSYSRSLSLSHNILDSKIPIKLESIVDGSIVTSFDISYLHFPRHGKYEIEAHIEGGQFAGSVILIFTQVDNTFNAKIEFSTKGIENAKADFAEETLKFFLSLLNGGSFRFSLIEDSDFSIELGKSIDRLNMSECCDEYTRNGLEHDLNFISNIVNINKAYKTNLKYSGDLDRVVIRDANLIALALENKSIIHLNESFNLPLNKSDLKKFVDFLKETKLHWSEKIELSSLENTHFIEIKFMDKINFILKSENIFKGVKLDFSLADLENTINRVSEFERIDLALRFEYASETLSIHEMEILN